MSTDSPKCESTRHPEATAFDEWWKTQDPDDTLLPSRKWSAWNAWLARSSRSEIGAHPSAKLPTASDILGAVARGWCHPKNEGKPMDPDLGIAIASEIHALLSNSDSGSDNG